MAKQNTYMSRSVIYTIISALIILFAGWYLFGRDATTEKIGITPSSSGTTAYTGYTEPKTPDTATGDNAACTREYAPVCGADGKTYSNECLAQAAKTRVVSQGECKSDTTNTTTGPTMCTAQYAPVCGVDGKTYSNKCMAGEVSIAHQGICDESESKPDIPATTSGATLDPKFSSGSYHIYQQTSLGYTYALPKYTYYQGYGQRDGASNTMAVGLTASGIESFDTAPVQIWYYRTKPATAPASQSVTLPSGGVIYVKNNDTTGTARIDSIISTVLQSAQ